MRRKLDLVVNRADLHAAGVKDTAIASRLARGELVREHRGHFLNGASQATRHERAALALKVLKGRGMVTGAEALRQSGHDVRQRYDVIDIVVAHGTAVPEIRDVVFRRSSHIEPSSPGGGGSEAVVSPAWALGDFARDATDGQVAAVVARGIARRLWVLDDLEAEALRRDKFPGRARLRRVFAALQGDLPFSGTEKRAAAALRRAGFEIVLQHRLVAASGRVYLLDMADVDAQVDIELDGPHHWLPDQATSDRRRDRDVRSTHRWSIERFSVYEVDADMDRFVQEAGRAIEMKRRILRRLGTAG